MNKDIRYNGYTAVPSDYDSQDGDLAVSVNLIQEDGAIHPIFPAKVMTTLPTQCKVVCVHDTAQYKHYIIVSKHIEDTEPSDTYHTDLYWIDGDNLLSRYDYVDTYPLEHPEEGVGYFNKDSEYFIYGFESEEGYIDIKSVEPIGNTLVVVTDDGMHYALWNNKNTPNKYDYLGQKPPQINISFGLESKRAVYPSTIGVTTQKPISISGTVNQNKVPFPTYASDNSWVPPRPAYTGTTFTAFDFSIEGMSGEDGTTPVEAEVNKITNSVLGAVNKFVAQEGMDKGQFVFPFLVRYAYELYDGSLMMHSYPCLMIPNSRPPIFGLNSTTTANNYEGFELDYEGDNMMRYTFRGRVYGLVSKLLYDYKVVKDEITRWKDIIKSVNIYITPPIYTYDQAGKVYGWKCMDGTSASDYRNWNTYYTISKVGASGVLKKQYFADIFTEENNGYYAIPSVQGADKYFMGYNNNAYKMPSYILSVPEKTEETITNEMLSAQFHKISSISIDDILSHAIESSPNITDDGYVKITDGSLNSLNAKETMTDDYRTRDTLIPTHTFGYNARLNIGNVQRRLHSPIPPSVQWTMEDVAAANAVGVNGWKIAVKAESSIVVSEQDNKCGTSDPMFIYYPDNIASEVYLQKNYSTEVENVVTATTKYYKAKLTQHPFLNGAYWFRGLWTQEELEEIQTSGYTFPTTANETIAEPAKIYTSEVNNPFFFPLNGINTVGTGEIMGISAAVKAMSQGQFGQFPLYAFTTDGVWALEVSSTGTYSAKQPATRDVCINPDSITQMDSSVLFATDRGIMMIQGSDTTCITDLINDKDGYDITKLPNITTLTSSAMTAATGLTTSFHTFLQHAQMIYDYTNQRVIVYNANNDHAYVYSLKSHAWGMMESNIASGINSYPEALAMTREGTNIRPTVINLSEYSDADYVDAVLITRPLKLDAPDIMKTVRNVIQRGYFDIHTLRDSYKPIRTILYGARELPNMSFISGTGALYNWQVVWSSSDHYLRGFSGTPYKYYQVALICRLKKDESITGCSVMYQPKLMNQPR